MLRGFKLQWPRGRHALLARACRKEMLLGTSDHAPAIVLIMRSACSDVVPCIDVVRVFLAPHQYAFSWLGQPAVDPQFVCRQARTKQSDVAKMLNFRLILVAAAFVVVS